MALCDWLGMNLVQKLGQRPTTLRSQFEHGANDGLPTSTAVGRC